jgi:hypothetical protein
MVLLFHIIYYLTAVWGFLLPPWVMLLNASGMPQKFGAENQYVIFFLTKLTVRF